MFKVYKITSEDGKVYIGCTKQAISTRLAQHKSCQKEFIILPHAVKVLQTADTLNLALSLEQYFIEQYDSTNPKKGWNRRFSGDLSSFPDWVNAGYGKRLPASHPGESNGMFGRKQSEETREKIRQKAIGRTSSLKGKTLSDEVRIRKNARRAGKGFFRGENHPCFGKKLSDEHKAAVSKANTGNKTWLGRKHSDETKKKMSFAKKGRPNPKMVETKRLKRLQSLAVQEGRVSVRL